MKTRTKEKIGYAILLAMLLAIVAACTCNTASAQQSKDCTERPVLIVGSASVGFSQYLEPQFKAGIWDNRNSSGLTAFAGYRENIEIKKVYGKTETTEYVSSFFGEVGYHVRLNEKIILHGYGGADAGGAYGGIEAMYQAARDLLIGGTFKRSTFGIAIYFRVN